MQRQQFATISVPKLYLPIEILPGQRRWSFWHRTSSCFPNSNPCMPRRSLDSIAHNLASLSFECDGFPMQGTGEMSLGSYGLAQLEMAETLLEKCAGRSGTLECDVGWVWMREYPTGLLYSPLLLWGALQASGSVRFSNQQCRVVLRAPSEILCWPLHNRSRSHVACRERCKCYP